MCHVKIASRINTGAARKNSPSSISSLTRRQYGQIGNTAEVKHRHATLGLAEQKLVKAGCQWRALATGCHVTAAKVRHDIDAGQFRQQSRVAELQGVAAGGLVPHGLAMRANGCNIG